jgi:hypothetical protein
MSAGSRYFNENKDNAFHPAAFPEVVEELAALKLKLNKFQLPDVDLVVISYAKSHSVRADLVKSHAVLIKILTSKGSCAHLENIFTACVSNATFRNSLETYLKNEMNSPGAHNRIKNSLGV